MTGVEFKAIRVELGCTGEAFARALGYGGSAQNLKTITYKFESGVDKIPPAIARLAFMLGAYGVPNERWHDRGDIVEALKIKSVIAAAKEGGLIKEFNSAKKPRRAKRRDA